jgi:hypothetical protein
MPTQEIELPAPIKPLTTKWRDTYLPSWKGRKQVLHKRDLRAAGYPEDFLRLLRGSFSRLPGGRRVSESVVEARDVHQLRARIKFVAAAAHSKS